MSTSDIPTTDQFARISVHRPHQSAELRREIRALEYALHGRNEHDGSVLPDIARQDEPQNREYLVESLNRTTQLYERHAAEGYNQRFNGMQKNKMFAEMKRLEAEIREGMPTHEMMETPNATNVDWWRYWHRAKKPDMLAWRAIRRILQPTNDDPNLCNISILRRHELTGSDPRKYWVGYEGITFDESVKDEIDQITDAQYFEFLRMKAQDREPFAIQRQLGWSRETYNAALYRLNHSDDDASEPSVDVSDDDDEDVREEAEASSDDLQAWPAADNGPFQEDALIPQLVTTDAQEDPFNAPTPDAAPPPLPPITRSGAEWKRRIDEAGVRHSTAARWVDMSLAALYRRFDGQRTFTETQAKRLEANIAKYKPRAPVPTA